MKFHFAGLCVRVLLLFYYFTTLVVVTVVIYYQVVIENLKKNSEWMILIAIHGP
jgi:hypothetical protein